MLNDFISFIEENILIDPGTRTLLAVSGGADSAVMAELFFHAGLAFDLAHANFQLRGAESERDELFVRDMAVKYDVKVFVKHFETKKIARHNKTSVQLTARLLRYEWFDELMLKNEFDQVATAHHLDDQVETFLINMSRGTTGIAGLHGIPVKQGRVIRPMMFIGRKDIEAYILKNKLDFVEDSSNNSVNYTRNRIRHKIIPQIEKINPSFRKTLTDTIAHIREVEIIYRQAIEQKRKEIVITKGNQAYIALERFFNLVPLETWAYELLSPFGFNHTNIRDITGLAGSIPGKEVFSTTHRVIKDRENLVISLREKVGQKATFNITIEDIAFGIIKSPVSLELEIIHEIPAEFADPAITAYLDFDKLSFPLLIRKWQRGDFFYPMGMTQRKKISDFFIDQKFSLIDKEKQWLLCSGENIVWIIGQRIDNRFKITSSSNKTLILTLRPEH